jgi:hypothetical protein
MEHQNGYWSDAIPAPEAPDSAEAIPEPGITAAVPPASGRSVEWVEPGVPASSAEEPATQPEARAPESNGIEDGVRRAVQQARAEIEEGLLRLEQASPSAYVSEAMQAPETEPEDAQREDVRRMVEQARAELDAELTKREGPSLTSMMPQAQFGGPAASRWQAANESMLPPVLVIEDNDGRVDLARVYEALSRLHCGGDATLLNHTPHSVTMGFNSDDKVPNEEPLANEVRAVFGRECQVTRDGNRTSVRIGGASEQRYSA